MNEFIQNYFINPVVYGTGYNIYNTLVYALVLIIAGYLVFMLIKKLKLRIDSRFMTGVVPFIVFGGLLRALQDAGIVNNILFITPLIYFVVFAMCFGLLLFSLLLERIINIDYHKLWDLMGLIMCVVAVFFMNFSNWFAFFMITGLSAVWLFGLLLAKKWTAGNRSVQRFLSTENIFLIFVHMFDASTTFTALTFFDYFEQHVVSGFVISMFGPAGMFLLKIPVICLVLWVLDRELKAKKDLEKRTFIKMIILILGLAPGIRNFVRLVIGV